MKSDGRGNLRCMDGQTPAFDGTVIFEVWEYKLPVSCIVVMDTGATGVFTVSSARTFSCTTQASDVVCAAS